MEDVLQEIVRACREDKRIFEIVQSVALMSREEKEQLGAKVKNYFLDKTGQIDVQAYRFYNFILDNANAQKIVEIVSSDGLCV